MTEETKSTRSLPNPPLYERNRQPEYGVIRTSNHNVSSQQASSLVVQYQENDDTTAAVKTNNRAIQNQQGLNDQNSEGNQVPLSLYQTFTLESEHKSQDNENCVHKEEKKNIEFFDTSVLIFKVIAVNIKLNSEKTLQVICPSSFPNKVFHVILKGLIWGSTQVQMGNYVRILAKFQNQTEEYPYPWVLIKGPPHDHDYIIVEPLLLLPPTSIIKMVGCSRKPFLDKNFVDIQQSTTVPYIKGIIVHQLFQQLIHIKFNQKRHPRPEDYKQCIDRLIDQFRLKIASLIQVSEQDLRQEATKAVDSILQWIARSGKELKMNRVVAIEQDYSSQRFGIRAKIDATVSVINQKGLEQVAAVELKSGKYQTEQYRGQVQFYALLILEKYKYKASMNHWLVYILNKNTQQIKYDYWQAATLIKLRNKMAFNQRNFEQKMSISNIPECVDQRHKRECKGCQSKPLCSLIHTSLQEGQNRAIPGIPEQYRKNSQMITEHKKQYMQKWMKLIGWKECVITQPVVKYAFSKYNFKWYRQSPFTTQSLNSLNLSISANANSSSQSKSYYMQITFTKISKGLFNQIHLDQEVSLHGNSVPMSVITGAIVLDKTQGNEEVIVKCDCEEIKKAKVKLSQTEGQQISDVNLNSYRWSIVPVGKGVSQAISSSDFAKLRGAVVNFCLKPIDFVSQQIIIEGSLPPMDSSNYQALISSLNENFREEFHIYLSPAQQKVVLKIIQGPAITLIDTAVGCGKSVVIAFLIKLFDSVGKSVLLTGNSLNQIDHVLQTMIRNLQPKREVPFIRIGNKKLVSSTLLPYCPPDQFKSQSEVQDFIKNKRIFALILKDNGHILFEVAGIKQFDYVIILGAQNIAEPRSLIPISKGKQVILVGDQVSMRLKKKPNSFDAIQYEQSLYTRLTQQFDKCIVEPFYNQFELNQELLQFYNLAFYDTKLYHSKNVPKEVVFSEFLPYPIKLDDDQGQRQEGANENRFQRAKGITQQVFGQGSPSICFIDVQENAKICSQKINSVNHKQQQEKEAGLIDQMLFEIKSQNSVNIRSQIHLFSPVFSNVRYLRGRVKSFISISNVDDFLRFRPKDCVILAVGIESLGNTVAFSPSTVPAMMRGKSKVVIVSKFKVLEKVKGFGKLVQFLKSNKSTHVFNYS